MKKPSISKEYLLEVAQTIVLKEGLDGLSIRTLATQADVSIGSVYNYFKTKNALIDDLLSLFWQRYFIDALKTIDACNSYVLLVCLAYKMFAENGKLYLSLFVGHFQTMVKSNHAQLHAKQHVHFERICDHFLEVLQQDDAVNDAVWTDTFTQDEFVRFTVHNIFDGLRQKTPSLSFLKELIERLIYTHQ